MARSGSITLDPLIGRVILERYEVLRRIGTGGMGAVYVGRQLAVGREVALKVLRQDLVSNEHVRQRFRREAEIVGGLSHPNTVQLIDYGETEGGLAVIVMELLKGQSLNERLKAHGPLSLDATLTLGQEVAGSLAEAHTCGLVHRDLKPANIFLAEVGSKMHGKVLDFGIARLLDEESTRLTSTGQVFGTPRYMSPEQALSTADVDARSDLYSLGLILYECLAGEPPFVAQTSIQYLSAHTTQQPPKLRTLVPDAPESLEALIDACLAKAPEERPASADDVIQALGAIRAEQDGQAPRPLPVPGRPPAILGTQEASAPTQRAGVSRTPDAAAGADEELGRRAVQWALAAGAAVTVFVVTLAAFAYFQRSAPVHVEPVGQEAEGQGSHRDPRDPDGLKPPDGATGPHAAIGPTGATGQTGIAETENEAPVEKSPAAVAPEKKPPPTKSPPPPRKPPPRRAPPPPGSLVGPVDEGPRMLTLPDLQVEDTDLAALAERCQDSVLSGLSSITTRRCPADCAVMIDEQCAGRTPAARRAVPPGLRKVAVVCKGKIKKRRTMRFREDKTRVFRCR